MGWRNESDKSLGGNQVEMRYNLATKVMRNGVEVIVATDRNVRPVEPEYLRLLSSTVTRPITLAPHTLTNLMSMVLPTDHFTEDENHLLSFLQPTFVTRTYYTTYNYLTTVLENNTTAVLDSKTTITNVKTEQYTKKKSFEKIQPTSTLSVTFKTSPTLQTEVHHTAYTYLNTFMDGDQPFVVTSTHTISNTQVAPEDSFGDLEPSETFPASNTYLKTIEFTKTLTDGTDFQIISTKDVVTQLVITDKPEKKVMNVPITTDVTKTYFVTYTYFSTYLDGDQTKVKSDVSVSSDVTIEKFYIKPKKTETHSIEKIKTTESPLKVFSTDFPINIFATRTYLTTFTYFTTLLQGSNSNKAETKINSRTKVVENTVTETVSLEDFTSEDLLRLNSSLYRITGALVTTATLKKGERIVITAHRNSPIMNSYQKYEIKPTKSVEVVTQTEAYHLEREEPDLQKIKFSFSKSKTTLLHKQNIKPSKTVVNDATAEALIGAEEEINSFEGTATVTLTPAFGLPKTNSPSSDISTYTQTTSVSPTSVVSPFEKTTSAEESMNLVKEESQKPSGTKIEPLVKKPEQRHPNNPMNVTNLLNLNSLGINGMNVLGPVFNAMAELIHNNLNTKTDIMTRRNDTVGPTKEIEHSVKKPTSNHQHPLLNFVNKFTPATAKGVSEAKVKVTTPRTPVYIPVGSFAEDSEFGESQDSHIVIANRPDNVHEKWTDIHAKNFEKGRPHDNPITILEGGIPISPGQVITTNSDVIIGRPGESGPRPPTFAIKNTAPIDMKPPPPPPHILLKGEDEDEFLGQHSTNQGIDFEHNKEEYNIIPPRPPLPPPKKHHHESHSYKLVRPHSGDRIKNSGYRKNPYFNKSTRGEYDSGAMDLNPPPKPPPPPPLRTHDVHRPITINHEPDHESEQEKTSVFSIPLHLGPSQNIENYINPAELNPAVVAVPTPQIVTPIQHEKIIPIISQPTPNIDMVNQNILVIPTVAHIPLNLGAAVNPLVDRSTGHQLLVNIQPSQVANIVIPHGSSPALIMSGGKEHTLKGEVIDDPSPHPEPETVGFVGSEPVLKIESDDLTTSTHNEVISSGAGEVAKQNPHNNRVLFSNRPQLTTELIKIRPKPNFSNVRLPGQHSSHLASEQHSEHIYGGQDQFGHQSLPTPQITHPAAPSYQISTFFGNHHQTENVYQGEGTGIPTYPNHQNAGHDKKTSNGIYVNQNAPAQNVVKGTANKHPANQNYRKEGPNSNAPGGSLFNNIQPPPQNIKSGVFVTQHQHPGHNYLLGLGDIYSNQAQIVQENHKLIKGGNGIYVDISPPGHLPPRPDVNLLHDGHSAGKHQANLNENLSNHQSGVVHDVPLNAQVQLGSGQKKENPLKEILISANTNKHDNIYNAKEKPIGSIIKENKNHINRPLLDLPDNLSPPPLPKEGNHRPGPQFVPPHPVSHPPKFPPHPHPIMPQTPVAYPGVNPTSHSNSVVPQIAEFMIPPPQVPNRPKPNSIPRPIPIGAGAPQQNYPNPRPEDILIVPHKIRPGANYVSNIKHESIKQTPQVFTDLSVGGMGEPVKTEYGEEIQESISRPLFPGQLPSELQYSKSHISNHKNVDNSKTSLTNVQTNKMENSPVKADAAEGQTLETNIQWNKNKESNSHGSEISSDSSSHWTFDQKQKLETGSVGKKPTPGLSSFFNSGKKPSGFVTANTDSVSGHHHEISISASHKETAGFFDNKNTDNIENHKPETFNFESQKLPTANRGSYKYGTKGSSANYPSGFVSNKNTNTNFQINAVGPNILPSGFVKHEEVNPEEVKSDQESGGELHTEESNQGPSLYTTTVKNENKESFGFITNINHKPSFEDISSDIDKEENPTESVNIKSENENQKNKMPENKHPDTTQKAEDDHIKPPSRFETNNIYSSEIQKNDADQTLKFNTNNIGGIRKPTRINEGLRDPQEGLKKPQEGSRRPQESIKNPYEGIRRPQGDTKKPQESLRPQTGTREPQEKLRPQGGLRRPQESIRRPQDSTRRPQENPRPQDSIRRPQESFTKTSETSDSTSSTKFNSNKVSIGYPTNTNFGIRGTGSNGSTKTSATNKTANQEEVNTFKKEELNKISGSLENKSQSFIDKRKPASNFPNSNKDGSINLPFGIFATNETGLSFGIKQNHNYENKTLHIYEPQPTFDLNEERDVTYNNAESDANNWFATNFGNNGNANKNVKPTKFLSSSIQNVTSTFSGGLPSDSDIQITMLTPPKMGDVKSKPEEVMGLSPPPLDRTRRPQRPQRPQNPYKFEIPTTPKSTLTPIAIENDFPPVRSPEFNRKPLKPQDIFPPRLPDNFVHHIPEFPVRNIPKPRPQERPVTSLPIDVPGSITTEKVLNIYSLDLEQNGGRDTYFAGSEINGHSKPIINKDHLSSFKPPPLPPQTTSSRPKPVALPKPTTASHQATKLRFTQTSKSEEPSKTKTSVLQTVNSKEILPTTTQSVLIQTTYHTKVSASVTPTVTHHFKDWQEEDIITGSETIFDPDPFDNRITPSIKDVTSKKNIVTTLISTGSTTIFGDLYTPGPQTFNGGKQKATTVFTSKQSTVAKDNSTKNDEIPVTPTKTMVPVHTTTLTVTSTMTTVVHSIGHKPFTKTIIVTKTLISTVFNKVTETKTLVKPTTATIIQTHTIATTKTALVVPTALYPTQTKYPAGGTMKPEIFMADPHAKDTMTISVSSSMNKNQNEDKRKTGVTRLDHSGKDSIIVVMSNKHPDLSESDNDHIDTVRDDDNEINDSRVVVGNIFDTNEEKDRKDIECSPGCKAKKNELCQRIDGVMKCVCRPGFARMFPDRPCRPTYTYKVKLMLEKLGSEQITYEKNYPQTATPNMAKLASATKEGLDRMIMQSDLRDVYHGVMVNGFQGKDKKTMVDFYVQLSENTDETKLMDIFKKTLHTSNYSLGGTELFAAREADNLNAEDFNECLNPKFHDCSENARCFNLKGTYTCSCKEGFIDLSENSLFPGRVCSDMIGCEYCGYHGACYSKGEDQITCECFQWYSGERCHINLKVLLIALVTIGAILLALLLVCAILTCCNRRSRSSTTSRTNGSSAGYLRYRGPSNHSLDRRAMIGDSSSESSVDNLPYICPPPLPSTGTMSAKKKPALRHVKGTAPRPAPIGGIDQRDRSVTVMIPRAKYRPVPPLSPHLTMSTFSPDKHLHKTAAQIATEQKLINYLDGNTRQEERCNAGNTNQNCRQNKEQKSYDYKSSTVNPKESPRPAEKKKEPKVFEYEYKMSNMMFTEETNSTDKRSAKSGDDRFRRHSDSTHLHSENNRNFQFRKYSAGALVSAGYEVSAKVGMHHLEDDTTEDDHSGIINTHTMKSSRSQFTTLNRTGDHKTMSEARSYDETTVHPQTRSLKTHYSGSSPSSRVNNDEGHTMIERDLGSTFIMPESQLFKPEADRGSDISNFDSL